MHCFQQREASESTDVNTEQRSSRSYTEAVVHSDDLRVRRWQPAAWRPAGGWEWATPGKKSAGVRTRVC